jgi:hypothetical protein
VAEEALEAVRRLGGGSGGWVRVDLDVGGERLVLGLVAEGGDQVSKEAVQGALVRGVPSYFLLRGGAVDAQLASARAIDPPRDASTPCLMLLFHCPEDAPVRAKMMAASARSVLDGRVRELGLLLPLRAETRDADDVAERFAPAAASSPDASSAADDADGGARAGVIGDSAGAATFAKPKGPGRRKK